MIRLVKLACLAILPILVACTTSSSKPILVLDSKDAPINNQENLIYRLLLAEIAGQKGHLDISIDNLLHVALAVENPEIAERATRSAAYAKDYKSALIAARRWIALAPDEVEPLQYVAVLALKQGETESALAYFQKLLALEENDLEHGFQIAASLLSRELSDQSDTVLSIMAKLAFDHQGNAYAHLAYGELALLAGVYELAEAELDRTLELKPGLDQAIIIRARLFRQRGRVEKAIADLDSATQKDPKNERLRLAYARLLLDAKRYPDAKTQFEVLHRASPEDGDLIYTLALLTLDMDQAEEARSYLQRLIALGHRESEANYYLGRIGEVLQDYPAAIVSYSRVDSSEYRLDAKIRIGQLTARMGKVEDAREYLRGLRYAHSEPSIAVRLFMAEAGVLADENRHDEAIGILTQGLLEVPGNTDLLYSRSLLYEKIDRIDLLENDLRSVVLREPENASALNALGYTLADRTDRYQEAYELIQMAMKIQPDDPAIIDSMGWVLYRMGKPDEAVEHLKRALTMQYDNEIAAHLGEVLWVVGQETAAKLLLQKALEKAPDNKHLLNVKKQFENNGLLRMR